METMSERNRRLYGRPRVPKRTRAVILALLTGAPDLTGPRLGDITGQMSAYDSIWRLEDLGWLEGEWENPNRLPPEKGRRKFYRLTPFGRAQARELLGLPRE